MVLDLARASEADVVHEIAQLALQLSTLKRHLNSNRPISRLPAEILLKIFMLIVDEWGSMLPWDIQRLDKCGTRVDFVPSYTWLPVVTHVCHYWREIALAYPCLWSRVIMNDRNSLRVMLKRSQAIQISLFYYIQCTRGEQKRARRIRRPLHPHLHRIKSLQIVSADPSHEMHVYLFRKFLSSIREITLFMLNDDTLEQKHVYLHAGAFNCWMGQDHDALLTLSLGRISFVGLQAATRPSLRHLSIHTLPSTVTMSMLLSVFKNTPLLTSLTLFNATPPVSPEHEDFPDPCEVVILSHLHSLRITSAAISTTNFLRHISYPALTTMNLDLNEPEFTVAQDVLGHNLENRILQNLRYVSLRADHTGFYLYGWPGIGSEGHAALTARTVCAPCTIRIHFEDIGSYHSACCTYAGMVSKINPETVEVVHLDLDAMNTPCGNKIWEDEFFYDAFCDMSSYMRVLYISSIYNLRSASDPTILQEDFWADNECCDLSHLWIERLPEEDVEMLNRIIKQMRMSSVGTLEVLSVPWNRRGEVHYERAARLVGTLEIRARPTA